MQKDAATAQANTLLEWASHWEREALAGGSVDGFSEIAFLLRRGARLITRTVDPNSAVEEEELPPRAESSTEPRADSPESADEPSAG